METPAHPRETSKGREKKKAKGAQRMEDEESLLGAIEEQLAADAMFEEAGTRAQESASQRLESYIGGFTSG